MDPSAIILDISSDEDFGWDDNGDAQFDWIAEIMDSVDKEKEESDEVVVVGEVSGRSASRKQNHESLDGVKSGGKRVDVDDDDCLILDGDPDKPVSVNNGTGNESDELLIVGEKGQLACRDYPHPRHLCATFLFSTTPHQKYCNMCHCYVCDSPAPCMHWGTGVSNTDHCHSNDKEEIWKVRRQCLKQGKTVRSPAPKQPETTLSMAVPLPQKNSGLASTHFQPDCGSVSVYSHSRSNPFRPCSSINYSVPNIISQRSNQRSGFVPQKNRTMHHVNRSPPLPHSSSITNTVVQRGRSTLGAHCASSNFKRVGTPGITVTKNQSGYCSSFSNAHNYTSQGPPLQKNHHSQVKNHRTRNEVLFSGSDSQNSCQSSSHPSLGSSSVDFHPYFDPLRPQVYSQPDPVPNDDRSVYSQNTCQSSSQRSMGSNLVGFHPYTGSLQPQIYSQPDPVPNEDQNPYPHEDPHPDTTNLNLSDYDLSWLDYISRSVVPSIKSTLQPTQPMPEPPPDINPNPQYPCIDATSREFDLGSWADSLEADAAKDALYEFDCPPHQADLGDTEKSWHLLDIEVSTRSI